MLNIASVGWGLFLFEKIGTRHLPVGVVYGDEGFFFGLFYGFGWFGFNWLSLWFVNEETFLFFWLIVFWCDARVDFDFELAEFFAGLWSLFNFFVRLDEVFGTFEESNRRELQNEGRSNKNQYNIYEDDEALVESLSHNGVEPAANETAVIPDGTDARNPEHHEQARDVNWDGDAIVFGLENLDRKIDEECWNGISSNAEAFQNGGMEVIEGGATVAKPRKDEKEGCSNHQDGDNLTPKTAWKFVLNRSFFWGSPGVSSGGFAFSC